MTQVIFRQPPWRLFCWAMLAAGSLHGTAAHANGSAPAPLEGSTWLLQSYGVPKSLTPVLPGTTVTAGFRTNAGGQVTGTAGCNSYAGGYTMTGNKLSVGALAATKKFCAEPAGLMDQESKYLSLMAAAAQYRTTTHHLEIKTKQGSVLWFTRLEGATWVLESLGDPKNPTPVVAGTTLTAVFGDQPGRLNGSGGCNSFSGPYKPQETSLSVGPLISTFKACPQPIMDQESRYFALLGLAEQYRISGHTLEIVAKGGAILRFVAP